MSSNYTQYLGAKRCCDLKVQGPQGVAYSAGQVLVGKAISGTFVTAGSTGGGAETVTLSANNLPAHVHEIQRSNINATFTNTVDTTSLYKTQENTGTAYTNTQPNTTTNTSINILQPYIVVYTWTRTV